MKKIVSLLLFLLTLFFATLFAGSLSGCSDDSGGAKVLGMMPVYVGEAVMDTHHTFQKEDFYVLVSYSDNHDQAVTDFTYEVIDLRDGYYTIQIRWKDWEELCYVKLDMPIYPSDME